jgi:hypothetical protein
MKGPFFLVCADGDVLAFDTASALTSYTESPDVDGGEYKGAFDSDATPLRLVVAGSTGHSTLVGVKIVALAPVRLEAGQVSTSSKEALKSELARALGLADVSMPFEELVAVASKQLSRH